MFGVEAGFRPMSECWETADVGLLASHKDFYSQLCKSGTSSKVRLSEVLQNKAGGVAIPAAEPSP